MIRVESSATIAAAPARVWTVLTAFERWHEWAATITQIERLGSPVLAVGSRFRIAQPRLRPAVWTVTLLRTYECFIWESRHPGVNVRGEHIIESCGSGCKVISRVDFAGLLGGLVGRLSRALTQEYLGLEMAGLKRRLEGEPL